MLLSDYGKHVLLPEKDFADFKRPEKTIADSIGHHAEWVRACKTGEATTCPFSYSGLLTEANHLGNVAYRVGKRIEWDAKELQELLRTRSGDQVTLVLDSAELERAIDADVEAHGLREAAAVFAVAIATAGAGAGIASAGASPSIVHDGGGASGTPIVMVSDAGSGGYDTTVAQSDANMVQVAGASQQAPEMVSDAALSGAPQQGPQVVSDTALSGDTSGAQTAATAQSDSNMMQVAAASQTGETPQLVSDAATSGPEGLTPAQIVEAAGVPPEMVSDAASSGPVAQAPEASGGGFSISAPDPTTTGIIAGGVALTIAAAAFTVRGRRPQTGHLA
jgi:hypothetical protein